MTLYNYEIGDFFYASGTVSTSIGSQTLNGSGTAFLSEFATGYLVMVGNDTRVVTSVSNNTTLSVNAGWSATGSGLDCAGVNLINVESLTTPVPAPRGRFTDYSQRIPLGSGGVRGGGWPVALWHWGVLTQAQRNQMRTFCTGSSTSLYIRTRENDTSDAYQYYTADMVWPDETDVKQTGRRIDFTIRFQNLVELSTS